jgi:hypothetical protein
MTNNDEHALGGGSKQKRIFGDNYFNPSYAAVLSMVSVDEMLKLSFLAAYLEMFRVEFNIFWLKNVHADFVSQLVMCHNILPSS